MIFKYETEELCDILAKSRPSDIAVDYFRWAIICEDGPDSWIICTTDRFPRAKRIIDALVKNDKGLKYVYKAKKIATDYIETLDEDISKDISPISKEKYLAGISTK